MQYFLNGAQSTLSDFAQDDLARAVVNSLFCWARAEADDSLPGNSRFGWWADTYADGDKFGSRLWLLARSKLTDEVLAQAEEYAKEALQWLIDDGIAESVEATAERGGNDRLNLSVSITRPDSSDLNARFFDIWEGMQ